MWFMRSTWLSIMLFCTREQQRHQIWLQRWHTFCIQSLLVTRHQKRTQTTSVCSPADAWALCYCYADALWPSEHYYDIYQRSLRKRVNYLICTTTTILQFERFQITLWNGRTSCHIKQCHYNLSNTVHYISSNSSFSLKMWSTLFNVKCIYLCNKN